MAAIPQWKRAIGFGKRLSEHISAGGPAPPRWPPASATPAAARFVFVPKDCGAILTDRLWVGGFLNSGGPSCWMTTPSSITADWILCKQEVKNCSKTEYRFPPIRRAKEVELEKWHNSVSSKLFVFVGFWLFLPLLFSLKLLSAFFLHLRLSTLLPTSPRGVHASVYDKNQEEHVRPAFVPDDVIQPHPAGKYWRPHPSTGVFGPADTDGRRPDAPASAAASPGNGGTCGPTTSVLDQKAWFRPLEGVDTHLD
ncbi:hypothetical protein Taro_019639 [Colocasia esculenta]|uniref:Uncharacterized protein n=1 Tax=Colocasia esculenta TaxID=4460 RepID=A0A843UU10_COLES|nr:hypothetical protein [Colocasia esculenta]